VLETTYEAEGHFEINSLDFTWSRVTLEQFREIDPQFVVMTYVDLSTRDASISIVVSLIISNPAT
jgi:hypothetical protein